MEQIIEYRAYAAAKMTNDVEPKDWRDSAMRTLAMQIEHELAPEDLAGE